MAKHFSMDQFKKTVLDFYRTHGRDLPWRHTDDPYAIMVSEIMLQQTQAQRVIPKYEEFLRLFPNVQRLAAAPRTQVLGAWQGLGYNRRALFLKQAAEIVMRDYAGKIPSSQEGLCKLPGIGWNTAGAICAYAFNKKAVFIETNIRRAFIYSFFPRSKNVPDSKIISLVSEAAAKVRNVRVWYWALMDYGTHLATIAVNPNRQSKHYVRQSKFEGSDRQIRGAVVRFLLGQPNQRAAVATIAKQLRLSRRRVSTVLVGMIKDGLVYGANSAKSGFVTL